MIEPTHTLTVDLATITGQDVAGIKVRVSMANPRLIYPVGQPSKTIIPTELHKLTNADGVAEFELLPSSQVGDYRVMVGAFSRVITMPEADTRLSALMDEQEN